MKKIKKQVEKITDFIVFWSVVFGVVAIGSIPIYYFIYILICAWFEG